MTRVTHIVPDTRITTTVLESRAAYADPKVTQDVRITQTIYQTKVRLAGPSVEVSGSSGGALGRERRRIVHRTSDLVLEAKNTGYVYTNKGADDDIELTLPASSGLSSGELFRFRVHESGLYLRVTAPGSDVIISDTLEATYLRCNGRGGAFEAEHQGDGEWFIVSEPIGLWLFDE